MKDMGKQGTLTIDLFGEIMDDLIQKHDIKMLIELPEGTLEPKIEDNTNLGPVLHFYVLLLALEACYAKMRVIVDIDPDKEEELIDSLLKLVKADLMEADR